MSFKERVAKALDIKPEIRYEVAVKEVEVIKEVEVPVEVVKFQVVEVTERANNWDKETRDAVATLPAHPGFLAITKRLAAQKALIAAKLNTGYHKELREVDYLQAGIFWLSYVQDQVSKATQVKMAPRAVDAYQEEMDAFKEIDSQIERVG